MSRLIVVSNRVNPPSAAGEESVGGLAMALSAALREYSGLWFGWSGKTTPHFDGKLSMQTLDGVTTALHICRGNYHSSWMCEGSLEPVAERVFGELPYDAFLVEWPQLTDLIRDLLPA